MENYGEYPQVDAVFSSPLKRCTETAKVIYPDRNPIVLDDLREYDFGEFEGKTAEELQDSVVAIEESVDTLTGLENANEGLTTQFIGLYENIEQQNYNIQGIDSIFGNLRDRVLEMGAYAEENQAMVSSIATATKSYRHYVNDIVEDTKHIHNLSAAMLETSASVRE